MFNLALLYKVGRGVPVDHCEAAAWFRKAADRGERDATFTWATLMNSAKGWSGIISKRADCISHQVSWACRWMQRWSVSTQKKRPNSRNLRRKGNVSAERQRNRSVEKKRNGNRPAYAPTSRMKLKRAASSGNVGESPQRRSLRRQNWSLEAAAAETPPQPEPHHVEYARPQAQGEKEEAATTPARSLHLPKQIVVVSIAVAALVTVWLFYWNLWLKWTPQTSGTVHALNSIIFKSPQSGWIVGNEGTILHTDDGGNSWKPQTSGTQVSLTSVDSSSPPVGWVVGHDGTILHTDDGGSSWKPQTSSTTQDLKSVFFSSPQIGWAVGNYGTMLYTKNGGDSWQAWSGAIAKKPVHSLLFIGSRVGWAIVDDFPLSIILHTNDGGDTWSQISQRQEYLNSLAFVDEHEGWAVGGNGTILHTHDGGVNWKPQISGTQQVLLSVTFATLPAVGMGGGHWRHDSPHGRRRHELEATDGRTRTSAEFGDVCFSAVGLGGGRRRHDSALAIALVPERIPPSESAVSAVGPFYCGVPVGAATDGS